MKHKKICFWIFLLLLLIIISGCKETAEMPSTPQNLPLSAPQNLPPPAHPNTLEPPTPTATSALTYQTNDGITLGTNLNCPDRAAFGYIDENVPARNVLVSSPIHFRWYYFAAEGHAPDWSTVCVPTSFTLYLSPGPDYITTISYPITPTNANNLVNLLMYSFYVNDALLQPHTSYRWMVVGHANGIDIDQDQLPLFQDESAWKLINNTSLMSGQFQTGPVCNPQTIGPVNLLNPQDQAALDTDTPYFQWDMPNCTGQAYWLSFDTDPLMASPDIGWVTGQEGFLMFSGSLQPCIIYNWQVQAGLYSYNYHLQNGDWATASEIRSFIIRSSECPEADAEPTATFIPILIPTNTPTKTPVIPCSKYDKKASCNAQTNRCKWVIPPTGGPGSCALLREKWSCPSRRVEER